MTPMLGIMASQISGHLVPPYDGPYGAFDSLATVTVGATAVASITFAGIPSGYKHLQIRFIARDSQTANTIGYTRMTLNGDTTTSYNGHALYGTGSGAAAAINWAVGTNMVVGREAGANLLASTFGANIIDLLDYANTNKYKTIRAINGIDANGSGDVFFQSGLWLKTDAVTSITLIAHNSSNFVQNSQFALYGVK
mgnify:CR=1 FL=1